MLEKNLPTVAIVGRTNVGKSLLFNQIVGKRLAVVADTPGITRDRNYALVNKESFSFNLIDTGGLFAEQYDDLYNQVKLQTLLAIEESDCIIAVLDGLAGLVPDDHEFVNLLRKYKKPILWVVNKCENTKTINNAVEFHALGIENYLCVSAAHKKGLTDLLNQLKIVLGAISNTPASEENSIKIAVIGKPNVGKSTFVNKIIGSEQLLTSPVAGTTRDRIYLPLIYQDQKYILIDTAGLRKKSKIESNSIERYSVIKSLQELMLCDVAVLMIDATLGAPSIQDLKLAALLHDRGKPFLIAVNKWDAVEKNHKTATEFKQTIKRSFNFANYVPIVFISALSGRRCEQILKKAKAIYEIAQKRIGTSELNKVLSAVFTRKPPPVYRGLPVKLYFATQIDTSPPTIVLFVNYPNKLGDTYKRFILKQLRKEFPFEGSNIKLVFKKRREE